MVRLVIWRYRIHYDVTVMKYTGSGEDLVSFMDFAAAKRMKWLLNVVSPTPIHMGVGETSHYADVIMSALVSQIAGVPMFSTTVCSGVDRRKHQSSASVAFVRGFQRWPVNSPHKRPVTRKMFKFDDVVIIQQPLHSFGRCRAYEVFRQQSHCPKQCWPRPVLHGFTRPQRVKTPSWILLYGTDPSNMHCIHFIVTLYLWLHW